MPPSPEIKPKSCRVLCLMILWIRLPCQSSFIGLVLKGFSVSEGALFRIQDLGL